jgi:3-hydroxyisobutyrate dehydrogenase-like beta-hydroxyacid dehydrogenase
MTLTIGVLHPGEMGSQVAAAAVMGGARVLWASEERGVHTRRRADGAGLEDAGSLGALVRRSDVVLSVCPPHAAPDVARAVAAHRFAGTYVDANAVSPATTREIGAVVERAGATFVDGGIVGPPPLRAGTTRLYLSGSSSGSSAARIVAVFAGSPLEVITLEGPLGAASALKMAYAAWTKGSAALLMAVRALAAAERVDEPLLSEWARSQPDLTARSEAAAKGSAPKAWRWIGEMEQIAATFAAAGLPDGFHRAAADVYQRLAGYKDAAAPPPIAEVAAVLAGEIASRPGWRRP